MSGGRWVSIQQKGPELPGRSTCTSAGTTRLQGLNLGCSPAEEDSIEHQYNAIYHRRLVSEDKYSQGKLGVAMGNPIAASPPPPPPGLSRKMIADLVTMLASLNDPGKQDRCLTQPNSAPTLHNPKTNSFPRRTAGIHHCIFTYFPIFRRILR